MSTPPGDSSVLGRLAGFTIARAPWLIGGWLLFVVAVNVLVPQLETVVGRDSTPFVPTTAPSLRAVKAMDDTFGNGRSRSFIAVVVERDSGLTAADRAYVTRLAADLGRDSHVAWVQDLSEPQLRKALTSRDGKAMYFQVGVSGYTGAPTSVKQVDAVRDEAERGKPTGLDVAVTGSSATITDMVVQVEHSIIKITIVTLVLIAIILMVIYRSVVVTGFVLGVIGIALAAARGVTAFLGLHLFHVSTFTGSFLTGVVLGATTDYAIFMISRFHELRRAGVPAREAARTASAKVSAVIVGSAFTVALATVSLGLAHVGLFRTTGPPIAVSVVVALGISLTMTPPVIALLGERGLLEPRPRAAAGRWDRLGALVIARPGRVFAAGLLPLLVLAALFPLFKPSYDERRVQPGDTESNDGYALMDAHYPRNEALPDFVLITADHDLRNEHDLVTLEQAADAAAQVPGVGLVRGVTRPTGTTISQASLGHQAGVIGKRLARAGDKVAAGRKDTDRLVTGAGQLSSGATRLADGADAAATGAGQLLDGAEDLHRGLERLVVGTGQAGAGSADLRSGAAALADGLETAVSQTQVAVDGLGLAYDALATKSLTCGLDPACRAARAGIRQIYLAERDQLVPGLRAAAAGARQLASGAGDLGTGLARVRAGLEAAERGANRLTAGQRTMRTSLGQLASGTGQVAAAGDLVEHGTGQLADSVDRLGTGLDTAASYLRRAAKATSDDPDSGGFYLPPSALDDPRFALSSGAYLSRDGRVARLIVLGDTNAFGHEAAARIGTIADTVRHSLRGTALEHSIVTTTGMAATNADIAELSQSDFRLVAGVALLAVFLVLLFLIRSLVAATALLASVVLSYAATMGLSVLVWQILIGTPIEWTVGCIAFVLLVAVGADYNLLLIKRVHEESPDGSRAGVARAVSLTGGVITAAGVIFAGSMFAMMSGSVTTLVQLGFTVGVGLLLDTFVVRTMVVPAFAALVGPRLWWPARATSQP